MQTEVISAADGSEAGGAPTVTVVDRFSLVPQSTVPGCARCNGLSTVEIVCEAGSVGTLVAEYPWYLDITDSDLSSHPEHAHYEVEWVGVDHNGGRHPELASSLYFSAVEMMKKAQYGLIPVRPVEKTSKRKK